MFKLTDTTGKLIVLRPDNTTPIARIVSTRLKNAPMPIKLCYNQNVFRISTDYSGKRSEISQTGIEIIGGDMLKSDIECVMTALRSLEKVSEYFGGKITYKLEIGHVGFYKAIVNKLGLSDEETELVRQYVEAKNSSSVSFFESAESDEAKERAIKIIRKIPRLFGGSEVFGKARSLAGENSEALSALEYLNEIYTALLQAGFGDNLAVDLAIVHKLEYYTGFVFRAYLEYAGEPVLAGGRYDMLLDNFEMNGSATGFGIYLSLISDAAAKLHLGGTEKLPDTVVHYDMSFLSEAEEYIENSDEICELSCFDKLEDTLQYAAKRGIGKVINMKANGFAERIKEV
jgi:ATP phosphoribosyltransferase involved in histidine biosynthesis